MKTSKEGLDSYDFGAKDNWRRWAWNNTVRRLKVAGINPRSARVAYLAGLDDLDLVVAERKGFCRHNLLAVSRDAAVVRAARDRGCTAVAVDVDRFLLLQPERLEIDAIMIDMCCGYTRTTESVLRALVRSRLKSHAVIAVNLLRGRDAYSNTLRALHGSDMDQSRKHRGFLFWERYAAEIALEILDHVSSTGRRFREEINSSTGEDQRAFIARVLTPYAEYEANRVCAFVETATAPKINDYRSESGQVFDSVIMNRGIQFTNDLARREAIAEAFGKIGKKARGFKSDQRRLIAAAAVMTSRRRRIGQ